MSGTATRTAKFRAYAKLNAGLRVLYKRPDGYHELRTVFQTISLADELRVWFTPGATTSVRIDGTPEIPDNLVEKAARLVLEELGIEAEVRFELKKRIPAGAGLGGGSSDAAAVLLALPVLAGRAIAQDRLVAMAAKLGSDVPFFLYGGTALGLGRGEELYPLPDLRGSNCLLVAPNVHSSTGLAYGDLSPRLTTVALQNKLNSFQGDVWNGLESWVGVANDFEEVVFARHPELAGIRDRLLESGAVFAGMTGSGSAIFSLFESAEAMRRAESALVDLEEAGARKYAVSFLSRAQYRSRWRRALGAHTKGNEWPPRNRYAQ